MKNKEEIMQDAKKSYENYFKDSQEIPGILGEGHDVVLDQDKIIKDIKEKKVESELKHESLDVLREKLTIEAETALKKTFKDEKKFSESKKLNTDQMYEQLNKEKEHLTQMFTSLKEEKLSKMHH